MSAPDPIAVGAELEALIAKIRRSDPDAATQAQRLTELLMSFYGAGLSRLLDIVRADTHGEVIARRLRADPLVTSILSLHERVPPETPPLIQLSRPRDHRDGRPPVGPRQCELCAEAVADEHAHVVDVVDRRLLCVCRTCRNVGGRYRTVPARYVQLPSITPAQWDALGLPVGLAFFIENSQLGRIIACYPGPAGAAESTLPLEAWPALIADNPQFRDLTADVEALLVRRVGDEYRCYLVPIDACYELIGRLRRTWTGLGGGFAAETEIDRFFESVREKSSPATEVCG